MDPEDLLDLVRRIEREVDRIRDAILEAMEYFAESTTIGVGAAVDLFGPSVESALETLDEVVHDFTAQLVRIIEGLGNPAALNRISNEWSAVIGATATQLMEEVEGILLGRGRSWSGDAADAYRTAVEIQLRALDDLRDPTATGVQDALGDAEMALWSLRFAIAAALLTVLATCWTAPTLGGLVAIVLTGAIAVGSAVALLVVSMDAAASGFTSTRHLTRTEWPRPAG